MSKQSFDSVTNYYSNTEDRAKQSQVNFFQLKNDGDEAIVRFMYDSTKDFDIHTTHSVTLQGKKYMKVECLREDLVKDPVSKCPLCENSKEYKMTQTFCVYMLQYVKNTDGTVTPTPVVWARPMAFAQKLKNYIDNYGPLSDLICKIIRHGASGDLQTDYEVVPNLSKSIYRDDLYVKVTNAFDGYTPVGKIIMSKTYDEMKTFVETKSFPVHQKYEQKNDFEKTEHPNVETPVSIKQQSKADDTSSDFLSSIPQTNVTTDRKLPWE